MMRRSMRYAMGYAMFFGTSLGVSAVASAVDARVASAQVTFPLAKDDPDFRRSTLPSECTAAARRLSDAEEWKGLSDTLPYDPNRTQAPAITQGARACRSHLSPIGIEAEPLPMYELAWKLGEKDSAWKYLARARAMIPPVSVYPFIHSKFLDDALTIVLQTQPVRLDGVDRLLLAIDSVPKDTTRFQINAYNSAFWNAAGQLDVARMTRMADGMFANAHDWLSRVPPDHIRIPEVYQLVSRIIAARTSMQWIDSGQTSALALLQRQAAAAFGVRADTVLAANMVVGTRPAAVADSGLVVDPNNAAAAAAKVAIPRGKVTALVFVPRCPGSQYSSCAAAFAVTRRVARRYGDAIGFVLVTGTYGEINGELFPDPAKERAQLVDYYFRRAQLPGILAVVDAKFTRKPDPDRRRIDIPTAVGKNFGKPSTWIPSPMIAVLDPSGTVVGMFDLYPNTERLIDRTLDGLLRNAPAQSSGTGAR